MISVREAQDVIRLHARPLPPVSGPPKLGSVLAEPIHADRDLPPFTKAMMDGFAVRAADCQAAGAMLAVVEEITAGRLPTKSISPGQAARVMTGAPVPTGADAVVMVEHCCSAGDNVAIGSIVHPGQHIQPIGNEMRRGEVLLPPGHVIRPQELGLLAMVGVCRVLTSPPAKVAILTTGDEIVEPHKQPAGGQIRNSNGPMLLGQCFTAGADPEYLGIARDEPAHLAQLIAAGLAADVLVLSGGVSAGKLDLVPDVLREAGVTSHIHKVMMKPGKPLYFGTRGKCLVFGLPGNPVSSFVGFELFIRPALRRLMGRQPDLPFFAQVPLADALTHKGDRPTYHPAHVADDRVKPVPWGGSPDLKGLCAANALVLFEAGEFTYAAGTLVPVYRLPE